MFNNGRRSSNVLLKILTLGLAGTTDKPEESKSAEFENVEKNDMGYTISACCNPIPGDDVVAISFPNQPLQIHRSDCPKAINLMSRYGKNIVKAKWKFSEDIAFMATLKITAVNRKGFGSALFNMMNENLELDLCSVKIKGESGMVDAVVSFYVNNVEQLDKVIGELRKMPLVNKVTRLERNVES